VLVAAGAAAWALAGRGEAKAPESAPSIVVILTDDQRWDTLGVMPTVQREITERGVTFENAFVVNPLCCPSRASFLTGRYSHSTGVYLNTGPRGLAAFDPDSTLATWLDEAGYETAYVGKYLNSYARTEPPPGWDRWVAFTGSLKRGVPPNYFGYELAVDGERESYGFGPEDYSTDVLGERAAEFVREADGALFLVFAPYAPHAGPTEEENLITAAGLPLRHADAFAELAPWRPESFDEEDVSDKPPWISRRPRILATERNAIHELRRTQLASLLAVDEAVAGIVAALRDTGRLSNTLIVFTSDNGQSWGEHRWRGKGLPYEESIRVPLAVRYDPLVRERRSERRLALNIDLAPTIAELAGVEAALHDGESLVPLLTGRSVPWRRDFLVEHMGAPPTPAVPSYCAVRSEDRIYVAYGDGAEELYDLAVDPLQLENRADDPTAAGDLRRMRARLRELCRPLPPGLDTLP
jgi:N-acetylglucosamine-6-sulfatase